MQRVLLFPVLSEKQQQREAVPDKAAPTLIPTPKPLPLGSNALLDMTPRFPARPSLKQRAASQPDFYSQRNSGAEHVRAV